MIERLFRHCRNRAALVPAYRLLNNCSAATCPLWMQSGTPTPRKALPASFSPGKRASSGFDPRHPLLMADMILRHGPRPMGDVAELRLAADAQQRPKMLQHQRQKLCVGHFGQLRPPRPAHEHPQQRLARRRRCGYFWLLKLHARIGLFSIAGTTAPMPSSG